jgi:undecaprenyl-phosphate 4-deoxy-4-formamido-L-arabinose transferase
MLRQTLSVVVPVYRAGPGLEAVVRELLDVAASFAIADGVRLELDEIVLVCDNPRLPVQTRAALRALEDADPRVRTVWLARNFGQHPATIAGIVSTNGDWVVTMDEDGQHDPSHIPAMLLATAAADATLTYARPTNPPPHGPVRNLASRTAKRVFRRLSGAGVDFHSFRLLEGSIARSACAYVGENVYLDVALRWSCGDAAICPLPMREELNAESSYDFRALIRHFWRMVVSTGTRPLRLIALGGVVAAIVLQRRLSGAFPAPGWTSVMVALLILVGGLFISLAVVAEYVGFAVRNTIGKPLYVTADHIDGRVLWTLQAALREARPAALPAAPETAPAPAPSPAPSTPA